MTPDDLLAREGIRRTQAAYHLAGDRGRLDDLVALFAPDGALELPTGALHGRGAIREGLAGVRPSADGSAARTPTFLRHHLTTSQIEVTGGQARAWSYFLVVSPVGLDHAGRYVDEYVDEAGTWLISRRRVVVEWAAAESVVGATVTTKAG